MASSDSTCWNVIQAAAQGHLRARDDFATRYAPVIRSYLRARWQGTRYMAELDDAVQEVFVDCFRERGTLSRFERERAGGFRAFLYGVTRIVALRFERSARRDGPPCVVDPDDLEADAPSLSRVFDRAWATAILSEAARLQEERAQANGADAMRRVELLQARFREDLPIREIARRWEVAPDRLHKEYARARREFEAALVEVVARHHPGNAADVQRQCVALIDLLG